ncbi:MFS transporter [Metabacillus sediminilitoris]|uniref:MFS transporter n=1 Tax=Metabacillus sediminilitoris TaxID=2567941 RepID=A0A4S4BPI2_9BACI|nr:MFS transporter [Metabacillus sediminilitoris]QGQ47715.1 MFS transporter [Metabacillus sediminilitoris]THF76820.1 MFS transporter [Metabacillus sediminilitoris]
MQNSLIENKKRHLILVLLFLGWCLSYLDRMAMNVGIVEIAKDFNLSPSVMGIVLSSFFAGYAIMQVPGGWLADKYGSRKVIAVAILFWSIFTVLTGMAWSLMSMVVIRFMFGLGEGAYPAASSKAIANAFPKKERPGAQTIMMSSNSLGGVIAPLIATPLLVWIGWKNLFLTIGILGIVVAWLLWHYLKPENMKQDHSEEEVSEKASFKDVIKIPITWKLAIMWFGMSTVIWGLISWMPPYLVGARGLDLMSMGMLTSIPALTGAIATVIGGQLIQSYLSGKEKLIAIVSSILVIVCLYLLYNAPSVTFVITFQSLCTIFHGLVFATIFSLPHKVISKTNIGTAIGIINLGGMIGAFLAPMAMGYLIEKFNGSYTPAFIYLIVCAVLSIVAAVALNKKRDLSFENNVIISGGKSI